MGVFVQHSNMKIQFFLLLSILSCSFAKNHECGSKLGWGTDRNSMADTVLYYNEPQSLHVRDELPYPGIAPDFERDNKNDTKEDKFGLNPSSGVFKAPGDGVYFVTFSAIIQTNKLDLTSYAQIFLLKNDKLMSLDDYTIAQVNGRSSKVSELRTKLRYNSSGGSEYYGGFNLQDIRFCIFY